MIKPCLALRMTSKINFLFYGPNVAVDNRLDEIDSTHCIRVLRKKVGDEVFVSNGKGAIYRCIIKEAHPKNTLVDIVELVENSHDIKKRKVSLIVCPTKSMDRMEFMIEKCVEIGVERIQFLFSTNTYPKKINLQRMHKIAVSAMKQSVKANLPEIPEAIKFSKYINQNIEGQKLIAHLDQSAKEINKVNLQENITILIGPEGDFTEEELLLAQKAGFESVSLGNARLRTETAALVSVSLLNLL